jgi:predicted permease
MISANLFATLGIKPLLGRSFQTSDDHIGADRVVMLDEDFWRERFGASPDALGGTLRLKDVTYTIVGVAPRSLRALGRIVGPANLYIPLGQWDEPSFRDRKVTTGMLVVARRAPGMSDAVARSDLDRVAANLALAYPDADRDIGITAEGLKETLVFRIRTTLLVLLAAVTFVLLIACADVANLMLVRSVARAREFATRTALGAGAPRLIRQLLAESVLLAALGSALGLVLASFTLKGAVSAIPPDILHGRGAGLDWRVFACVLGFALLAAAICGCAPALRVLGGDVNQALKEGGRVSSKHGQRLQAVLVVIQVSLALVLMAGSVLMIRSVSNLWKANPGFDAHNVLTFEVMPSTPVASQPALTRVSFRNLTEKLQSIRGVETAAIVLDPLPLSGIGDVVPFQLEGQVPGELKEKPSAIWYHVGPDYFRTMRIPLLRGRLFTQHDDEQSPHVMIIDENLAKSVFANEDPIGKRLDVNFIGLIEIVGVVRHVNHWNAGGDPPEWVTRQMYFPDVQLADKWLKLGVSAGFNVVVRTRAEPLALAEVIRARTDAGEVIYGERSMEQVVGVWLATRRFLMMLLSIFATLALLLACASIYGVLAYLVGQRTQELSLRMALGAPRVHIVRLVIADCGKLVLSGITIGIGAALALARFIANQLYGVQAHDPLTFTTAAAILVIVAAAASFVPARRAMRIDPVIALR